MKKTSKPAVVTVGDEILYGERNDENRFWICQKLATWGHPAAIALSLPDEEAAIASWIKRLKEHGYQPVIVSGGIGGTHDDRTREGIAEALGLPLVRHETCHRILSVKYGTAYTAQRQKMALLPKGCELIDNPIGAPGFMIDGIFAFPGFPEMLHPMVDGLQARLFPSGTEETFVILEKDLNAPEGVVGPWVATFVEDHPEIRTGIYPHFGSKGPRAVVRMRVPQKNRESIDEARRFLKMLVERFSTFART